MPSSGLSAPQRRAVELFRRGACVRRPNEERQAEEGHRNYKKGWEIRFYVASRAEAMEFHRVLLRLGLEAGRPYRKSKNRWILPLYGRDPVQRFLGWVAEHS